MISFLVCGEESVVLYFQLNGGIVSLSDRIYISGGNIRIARPHSVD